MPQPGRHLEQQTARFPVHIAHDRGPRRLHGVFGYARFPEAGAVQDARVPRAMFHPDWNVNANGIQVSSVQMPPQSQRGIVVTVPADPAVAANFRRSQRPDHRIHRRRGGRPAIHAARRRRCGKMWQCSSTMPGSSARPPQSMTIVSRSAEPSRSDSLPIPDITPSVTARQVMAGEQPRIEALRKMM